MESEKEAQVRALAIVCRIGRVARFNGAVCVLGSALVGMVLICNADLKPLALRVLLVVVTLCGGIGGGVWLMSWGTRFTREARARLECRESSDRNEASSRDV